MIVINNNSDSKPPAFRGGAERFFLNASVWSKAGAGFRARSTNPSNQSTPKIPAKAKQKSRADRR